ncbi:MAG: helix-turn-helix transcriptional regulator [Clostridia bacterium]|jgi:transcriptional regulator with XRE-family HTH domain|nr:helix-turn-helix transcriptional regulator [Clostridia bacterium]
MYGQKIRELRQEKNLTQLQLAEMLDTTASTVGKYEREFLQPNVDMITKLCKIFDVSADYLLGLKD